ncbi:MAG: class I SAM-dependent methyltransferase, partial [Spirochaetales bacterium]
KIQQNLVEYLDWNGDGTVLDIGCGSAALSVRVAKTFENASLVGVDYWGPMWDYSESMCCKNAELEGVATRCTFKPGNAIKLDFADESFDAVVSNFMYHEVLGAPDKKALILESLRVLKKGGAFSLQDYFDRESMFGSPQELVDYLKAHGISEVFYEGNIDNKPWIPKYVLKSFIIKDIAVIWGKK